MSTLARYSTLQRTLVSLEEDLGISEFNHVEKRIIAGLSNHNIYNTGISVQGLLSSELLKDTSQATLYRAISRLKQIEYIEAVGNNKTGNYQLVDR